MVKKAETKTQTSPIENLPGDWGTLEDIAELEREAKAAMQLAIAAEAKVTAAKALAKKAAMKNLADLMDAAGITIYELAEFKGVSLQASSVNKEPKPVKKQDLRPIYFNPANPAGKPWSGKGGRSGRGPNWIQPYWIKQDDEGTHIFKDEVSIEFHEKNGTLPSEVRKILAEYDSKKSS